MEIRNLVVELADLGSRHLVGPVAVVGPSPRQIQERLDLCQREAQLLCALDETHGVDGVWRVRAIPGFKSPGARQQSSALVITQGFDVDAGPGRDLSTSHSVS